MEYIEIIKELVGMDDSIIIVGSGGLLISGYDVVPKDIDIVVKDTKVLETFLDIKSFGTNGYFSKTNKRGYTTYKGYVIDIFIDEEVLDTDTKDIDGVKITYRTIDGLMKFFWDTQKRAKKKIIRREIRKKMYVLHNLLNKK
jgi:hypothetical protein